MPNVKREVTEGCGIIVVNRPEVLNALDGDTMEAVKQVLREFLFDGNVRAVILTGGGDKAFIAGGDINEMAHLAPVEAVEFSRRGQDLTNFIDSYPKPIIAAVNGYALGGGCEIALACHIRIASENARFGQPEVNLGLIPGWGGTQRLPRLVGKGKAIEMIVSGNMISAEEARETGLVNQVVPPEELMPAAFRLAKTILKRAPAAVRLSLEAIHQGMEMTLDKGLEYEANLFGVVASTEDKFEGTKAFLEKRQPNFKGE